MRKNDNKMNIEGKIYQFDLQEKVSGERSKNPGAPYIAGTIDVAVDSTQENIVQVHYTWVPPVYSSGKTNNTYTALKQIIETISFADPENMYRPIMLVASNYDWHIAQYLRECLDSVVNQTIESKEVIIIDDGSTDSSSSIVDEYSDFVVYL